MIRVPTSTDSAPKSQPLKLSVVIPVHNGGQDLQLCLDALKHSIRPPDELIVVDDASTDRSAQLAAQYGILVSSRGDRPMGPALCRNQGVKVATGDIVIFLDADVKVHRETLALIERQFVEHPEIAALFGSYDDQPPHRSLVSLYKNLQHHFVHQHGRRDASSFWTGLGAIRRDIFVRLGGFSEGYTRPSIEDIELGVRLKAAGYGIHLCAEIQATHLKRWNLQSLLRTDIRDRAVPWARLIFNSGQLPADLNLDWKSRASALCVWGFALLSIFGFWFPIACIGILMLIGFLMFANFRLYSFFYEQGGIWFAMGAALLHFSYFFYSSLTFGFVWLEHLFFEKFSESTFIQRNDG